MDGMQQICQKLVASDDTYGTTMLAIAVKYLPGPDDESQGFFEWDPLAVRLELQDTLQAKLSEMAFNRLMAAITLVTSNEFYVSLQSFVPLVNALSAGIPPGVAALPDAFDVTWGLTEGILIWPPDDGNENPFAPDIVGYIAAVVKREGIINPPDILRLGLRDDLAVLTNKIHADFSDDPTMFNAIFDTERSKTAEIESDLKENLQELVRQLASVGDTSMERAAEELFSNIAQEGADDQQLRPA